MGTTFLGVGHHLPEFVDRVGVRRPIAVEPGGPSHLAAKAAASAFERAGSTAADVDFIVFATMTPDVTFPGSGCYLQDHLGCDTVGALDIRAQCAGFVFGLVIADRFLRAGVYRNILLAGAEVHSSGLDYSERGAAVAALYGDGAGVALVGPGADGKGVRGSSIHSDGRFHKQFWCEYPASYQHPVRVTVDDLHAAKHFTTLDFESVRRFGADKLPQVIGEALQEAKLKPEGVDRYIIGHIFPDVAESAAKALGITSSRVDVPASRYGHLTAAAIPVALSEEIAGGKLGSGATVCLAACGAGFTWGAAVVTL
ncbi:MAG TPA: 3-oxoacyl-[acyl-carrier-protein] synthase III C-terminal domain-containing protein [Candidatus Acidoferrales bacterium]|nr:3-oxoacyl-[acyl-carrier-protein] synthase III C-terminal domain-containing protein [Candidatus Acidoferrales bacterium]